MIVHQCGDCGYDYDEQAFRQHLTLKHCDPEQDPLDIEKTDGQPAYRLAGGPANYAHEPPWNAATALPTRQSLCWVEVGAWPGHPPKKRREPLPMKKIEPIKTEALF